MSESKKVVVHLVHGTWPYGAFRSSLGGKKAWFEEGSQVLDAIRAQVAMDVEFRPFRWSGRNSFSAREFAAQKLFAHLDAALSERPNAMHLVLAHSHGGTVAAKTLAMNSQGLGGEGRIRTLICMATPFAYISDASDGGRDSLFFGAVGSLLTALAAMAFPSFLIALSDAYAWSSIVVAIFGSLLLGGIVYTFQQTPFDLAYFPPISPSVSIHLLRGTRDEASLVIGLAQSIHAITDFLYRTFDEGPKAWSPVCIVVYAFAYSIFLAIGVQLGSKIYGDRLMEPWQNVGIIGLLTAGVGSFFYLTGYGLVAMSVGFYHFRYWPATLEVETAPPGTRCLLKSFDEVRGKAEGLRHRIYELPAVQREVASLIQETVAGKMHSASNASDPAA